MAKKKVVKKKKEDTNHWVRTFGGADGHKVLKEILLFVEEMDYVINPKLSTMVQGRRQVATFIKDRLKASARNKETYAGIIYEMEVL